MILPKSKQKDLIVKILMDSIIFTRVEKGINQVIKSSNPSTRDRWEDADHYSGFGLAFELLELTEDAKNEHLLVRLNDIFYGHINSDAVKSNHRNRKAYALALIIYDDWISEISDST